MQSKDSYFIRNDWYYSLVAFVGFFSTLILYGFLTQDNSTNENVIMMLIVSALVPTITLIIIHRYRQGVLK